MRNGLYLAAVALMAVTLGCSAFKGYLYESKHFPYSTVREVELSQSVKHAHENLQKIAHNFEITIKKTEMNDETIQVWASKNGVQFVFDITSTGEQGCKVRLEMEGVGHDQEAWSIMQQVELFP